MKEISCIRYSPQEACSTNSPPECLCRKGTEVEYEWRIGNFSMCPQAKGQALESTSFTLDSLDRSEFKLVLYPRGRAEDDVDNVTCFLDCLVQPDYNTNVTFTVLGSTKSLIVKETFVLNGGRRIGFVLNPDGQKSLISKYASRPDAFTIRCLVTPEYNAPHVCNDFKAICRDYSELFENGDFSDFVIEGRQGETYKVHKLILTARSHHLAKRLGLLDDKNISEGNISDMNPPVLRAVLYYLYSGKLRDDLSPNDLSEVHEAARRYHINDLKRHVFPLESLTIASTPVKVIQRTISWDLEGFHSSGIRNGDIDWPIRTFIDLTLGRFSICLSVQRGKDDRFFLQIRIRNQSVMTVGNLLMRCNVCFDLEDLEPETGLCSGEHFFEKNNIETLTFSIDGDLCNLYRRMSKMEYPVTVTLYLRFELSSSEFNSKCGLMEVRNCAVDTKSPCNRSYRRLSSDLDRVFRRAICEDYEPGDIERNFASFTDLMIKSPSGKVIPVHRCILSARSNKFREYFEHGGNKRIPYTIDLADISDHTLEDFLRYVYSGKVVDMSIKRATLLYLAAIKFEVPALMKTCTYLMKNKMKHSDVYALLLLADDNKDDNLLSMVQDYIRQNRSEVFRSRDWENIVFARPELAFESYLAL